MVPPISSSRAPISSASAKADESSDTPAPTVEALTSFGGGGTSTLEIVALVLAIAALVVGVLALVGGRRELA